MEHEKIFSGLSFVSNWSKYWKVVQAQFWPCWHQYLKWMTPTPAIWGMRYMHSIWYSVSTILTWQTRSFQPYVRSPSNIMITLKTAELTFKEVHYIYGLVRWTSRFFSLAPGSTGLSERNLHVHVSQHIQRYYSPIFSTSTVRQTCTNKFLIELRCLKGKTVHSKMNMVSSSYFMVVTRAEVGGK